MSSTEPLAWPWRSTLVALAAVALYALAGPAPEALVLTRGATLAAQPWGLLTGHLAHSDPGHLLWDAAGLLLIGLVYEPLLRARVWMALGLGVLVIDISFLVAMTDWTRYCGLSGLINALVGAGLIAALRHRDAAAIGFGLLVLAKVLVESFSGTALLTDTSWPAVPMAHLAGILAGVMAGLGAEILAGMRAGCRTTTSSRRGWRSDQDSVPRQSLGTRRIQSIVAVQAITIMSALHPAGLPVPRLLTRLPGCAIKSIPRSTVSSRPCSGPRATAAC